MRGTVQSLLGRVAWPASLNADNTLAHERLRLAALIGLTLCNLVTYFGTAWDSQWHVAFGRDDMWIPPHVLAGVSFAGGMCLAMAVIGYEFGVTRAGTSLAGVVRIGPWGASPAFLGVAGGYVLGTLSFLVDDAWHRAYGLDATLWSPPHWLMAAVILMIDVSLMISLASAARGLHLPLSGRNICAGSFMLASAFAFAITIGQLTEAFVVGHRAQGIGLMGILFPVVTGVLLPLPLLLNLRLSGRFWTALPAMAALLVLQYLAIGLAQLGAVVLQPVSAIDEYVRLEPQSAIAVTREFARLNGFTGPIGHAQAWALRLSVIPLGLVALLELWPWARRHPLVAAPVYSASLVIVSFLLFQRMPVMAAYETTWGDVALGAALAGVGGLLAGQIGLWLARIAGHGMREVSRA